MTRLNTMDLTDTPETRARRAVISTRLDPESEELLREIARRTELPPAYILKRAAQIMLPKFLAGEVPLVECPLPEPRRAMPSRLHVNGKRKAIAT